MANRYIEYLTDEIYIKTLEPKDIGSDWLEFINDDEVTKYLKVKSATEEELLDYLVQVKREGGILFGIFIVSKEQSAATPLPHFLAHDTLEKVNVRKHIGNVRIGLFHSTATFAIVINKKYWGKGIGTKCLRSAIKAIYNHTYAEEVLLEVQKENKTAISLYEDAGFRIIETTEPYKDGRLHYKMRLEL